MFVKKSLGMVKIIAALLIVALLLIIYALDPSFFPKLWQVLSSGDLKATADYIDSFGVWAFFFSFWLVLFVNTLGFPPAIIFSTANTLIFGIIPGIVLSVVAETCGVVVSFLLLRFLFRTSAEKIIAQHASLKKIDSFSGKNGFTVMLIARMVPYFPSILLNAFGAISAISLFDYTLASLVGKFPSTAIEAIIGHDTVAGDGDYTRIIIVCILAVLLIIGAWWYERRAAQKAAADTPAKK
jgi:uncharacterized membrane protein YdjX (TVP38/TMEM64 family)